MACRHRLTDRKTGCKSCFLTVTVQSVFCIICLMLCYAGQPAPSNLGQCGRVRLVVSKVNSAACLMNIEA